MGNIETMATFIERNGIRFRAIPHFENPNTNAADWPSGTRHWKCTLKSRGSKRTTVYFSQGPAIREEPTAADVLSCLASDSAAIENNGDFEQWAEECGMDTDSREAERLFRVCRKQAAALWSVLGPDEYERLLWEVEPE